MYYVCHIHEPYLTLCGVCGKSDLGVHQLAGLEPSIERIDRCYKRIDANSIHLYIPSPTKITITEQAYHDTRLKGIEI